MDNERIKMLQQGALDEPDDPFYPYGLALEYLATEPAVAAGILDQLIQTHPDYLPTYYTAAKLFSVSQSDKAIRLLETGLQLAKKQNNGKAQREIQSALDELMF